MAHTTKIERSTEGLIASCSCRMRTTRPVSSRQEAEDWIRKHEDEVRKAQAGTKPLTDARYLEYLREQERTAATASLREQWKRLADEFEPRVKGKGAQQDDTPLF